MRILKDLDEIIEGRDVLVVEDILDTGLTLKYLLKNLASRKPRDAWRSCALLSKEGKQRVPIQCKYVGFSASPTSSSSDMAWTLRNGTATCRTSGSSSPRRTRSKRRPHQATKEVWT